MNLEVASIGTVRVVRVHQDHLRLPHLSMLRRRLLAPLPEVEPPLLILDLCRVSILGSAALACLMDLARAVSARGGTCHLFGLNERTRILIRMTKLCHRMPDFPDQAEALSALSTSSGPAGASPAAQQVVRAEQLALR
jgi:anti-anti-sigma factor